MRASLEATGLGKRYRRTWALRNCSLRVPTGSIAALVGPNGAGKSTLLHLATGLLRPTEGDVRILGWAPRAEPQLVLARLGFVAQDTPLYRRYSVGDTSTREPVDPWAWFDQSGPAFTAYVAFALALGVALGAVVGRTYPAMALTLVVYVTVRVPVEVFLRPRYMTPLRMRLESLTTLHAPPGRYLPMWLDIVYQTRSGRTLTFQQALQAMGPGQNNNLAAHGLVGWAYYQPGDHFWAFQGIEATIFLALAALLVGLTFYWVNRRIA